MQGACKVCVLIVLLCRDCAFVSCVCFQAVACCHVASTLLLFGWRLIVA